MILVVFSDQASIGDPEKIEVFVARLRRKLGAALIETVRGLGYRIRLPEA